MKHKGSTVRMLLALVLMLLLALPATAGAQDRIGETKSGSLSLASVSVNDSLTAHQLAELLVGTEVELTNISFTGNGWGSGSFSDGTGIVGFESGVILGSGRVIDVPGPNTSDGTTTAFGEPGDSDLDGLIPGYYTHDATVLEFDFECPEGTGGGNVISFEYVFTSEEYNEYVNSDFNDVFGFFLNGTNIALLPDGVTPVSINNVNNGYSWGGGLPGTDPSNPEYYINNDLDDYGGLVDIEADGLTVVLGAQASINPGVPNHMKLAIADAGDEILDSWVFLKEGSFVCAPLNQPPTADPDGPYVFPLNAGPFDGTGSFDPDGDPLTYAWDFGDSGTGTGATPSHTYADPLIYDVCLTVNDGYVDSDEVCTIAVIYDPSAGFVTGGGWIYSEPGAYAPDLLLEGKATFGFVSKYKKGATTPTGNTEFQFHAAGLNFHSDSYDWLVVTGSNYAMFKGMGTINGEGEYKFMLWAGDDDPDTFRIKIWEEDEFGVETKIYDNGKDQAIGGGSIVIHKK